MNSPPSEIPKRSSKYLFQERQISPARSDRSEKSGVSAGESTGTGISGIYSLNLGNETSTAALLGRSKANSLLFKKALIDVCVLLFEICSSVQVLCLIYHGWVSPPEFIQMVILFAVAFT
jgi:hypothetical protein